MRDDDFFIPRNQRDHLTELLTTTIPGVLEDLIVTAARQDRISRPELSQTRKPKRPESRPPLNFEAAGVEIELHAALVGAVRLMCESRGVDYDGNPTTLGLCGWLQRNVTAIALTEGAEDIYHSIDMATKAALRAVDHRPILEHYVGTCVACDGDLYARRSDTLYACRCGTTVTKLAQDERILNELEGRNYTAQELVDLVRAGDLGEAGDGIVPGRVGAAMRSPIEHIVTAYLVPCTSEPVERARCTCGWSYRGATGHRRELLHAIETHDRIPAPAGMIYKEDS